ncbi:D-alanyl-D-alanine carboxypeptidase [Asanoa hainanensis]|uniref:D-alanyl-D-alanine carboxypeptidase n=1 Tax=Asanoa hainanensis TaxID=560556 RepID=A0A239MIC3_9ACTN|nr:serine hydrolase domain-containing protein [Asanoa hainanensis]SNT41698.1 D-alanyl-D-alanine carboxypeptidase [Asanoa hainanensis]
MRRPDRIQLMLDDLVAAGSPGALAQFRDEDGTVDLASGVAELGAERPVAPDGFFRIGSVTKTFTAVLVLQLVGEGRLDLADTVERWLPGLVPGGITVRQLLDHTSGLHNYTDDLDVAGILRDRRRRWQPREMVDRATAHGPRFAPGTDRAYCNTGYILLGMIIEAATRSTYSAELEQRVLGPLELKQTALPADEKLPEPHAHAYLPAADGELVDVTAYDPSQAWAAGGMISTAGDLNRFFAALLTGALPADLEELRTTTRLTLPDATVVWGKDGGFFGYRTLSFHTPDAGRQLTVSVTTAANGLPPSIDLLAGVAAVFTAG